MYLHDLQRNKDSYRGIPNGAEERLCRSSNTQPFRLPSDNLEEKRFSIGFESRS